MTRPLAELESEEDAWPDIEAAAGAAGRMRVLPAARADGERVLLALQVTTRSPLGAVALHAAALLVDDGWLTVLGAGGEDRPLTLAEPLGPGEPPDPALGTIVAHDAVGGFFVLDDGSLAGERGEVVYLAPDTLEWERTELGYGAWLDWALTGPLDAFAAGLRWPSWREEVAALAPGTALHFAPPPWTAEGRDLAAASRSAVPVRELWSLAHDFRRQLGIG